jgi:hypothetical protein
MPSPCLPLHALALKPAGPGRILELALAGPCPFRVQDPAGLGPAHFQALRAALGPGPVRLAAHGASRIRAWLEAWATRMQGPLPALQWRCTRDLARAGCAYPGLGTGLAALAGRFGLRYGPWDPEQAAAITLRLYGHLEAWQALRAAWALPAPLIYLAGPVRGDGTGACMRYNQARMLRLAPWVQGLWPEATLLVPHGAFAFLDESRDPGRWVRDRAMAGCERLLARSDALVLCGPPSPGMAREQALARELGLPVFQMPGWDPY